MYSTYSTYTIAYTYYKYTHKYSILYTHMYTIC